MSEILITIYIIEVIVILRILYVQNTPHLIAMRYFNKSLTVDEKFNFNQYANFSKTFDMNGLQLRYDTDYDDIKITIHNPVDGKDLYIIKSDILVGWNAHGRISKREVLLLFKKYLK